MPRSRVNRQAGQNVRELAAKRRIKAITSFISAGMVVILPVGFIKALENFLRQIATINPQQSTSLPISPLLYVVFGIMALSLIANGIYWWKRAGHADQGAKGEEEIAQVMAGLEQLGWQVEYGMRLGNRLGDADVVCISPQGKAFVIDVKSHRGEVTTDGKQLYRRMGKTTYSFEKNFLEQAVKQALQVKKQKRLSFVTPIVAFSDAQVSVPAGKIQNVYVVEKARLLSLLKSLDDSRK